MHEIRVPKVGMSTLEVEVTEIFVTPGEQVSAAQVLMSVAADKVDLDIQSDVSGLLDSVTVNVGDDVSVGTVVAYVRPE